MFETRLSNRILVSMIVSLLIMCALSSLAGCSGEPTEHPKASLDAALKVLEDGDCEERRRAVGAYDLMFDPDCEEGAEVLVFAATFDVEPSIRRHAVRLLGEYLHWDTLKPDTLSYVVESVCRIMMADISLDVRVRAAEALGEARWRAREEVRGKIAVATLRAALDDPNPHMRQAAAETLRRIGISARQHIRLEEDWGET